MAIAEAQAHDHREVSAGFRNAVAVIDRFADYVGRAVAWLIIPMTVAVTWEVVSRHFFRAPTIWAFDTVYMLYGTHFMLGTGYTLMRIGHVRIPGGHRSDHTRRLSRAAVLHARLLRGG